MTQLDRRALIASAAALGACSSLPPREEVATPVPPRDPSERTNEWWAWPAMPWPVQEIYAAVWMGRVAVAGGLKSTPGQPLHIEDRLALYDRAVNEWTEGACPRPGTTR